MLESYTHPRPALIRNVLLEKSSTLRMLPRVSPKIEDHCTSQNTPDADAMNRDSLDFHGNEMYKNGTDMEIEQREASFEDMPLEDKLNRLRTTFPGAKDLDISTTLNKSHNNLWNAVKS